MKTSDRLVRAGIVFIMLGSVALLLPEDGRALAVQETYNAVVYTFGQSASDTSSTAPITAGSATGVTLDTYSGSSTTNGTEASKTITVTGDISSFTFSPALSVGTAPSPLTVTANTGSSGKSITLKVNDGSGSSTEILTYTITSQ